MRALEGQRANSVGDVDGFSILGFGICRFSGSFLDKSTLQMISLSTFQMGFKKLTYSPSSALYRICQDPLLFIRISKFFKLSLRTSNHFENSACSLTLTILASCIFFDCDV